jgi:hypothetical protein
VSVKPITKSNKSITASGQLEGEAPPPTLPGQIGEGIGVPLTKSQRRRALYGLLPQLSSCVLQLKAIFFFLTLHRRKAERFRQPLIRSNPEFAANPFETIRTHARNTLVPHRPTT